MNLSRIVTFSLLMFGLFSTSDVSAQRSIEASQRAKEHFSAGVAHVEDPSGPKYEEAYRQFTAAYAESPLPTIALNIGYCAFFLERDSEALAMYELYLANAADGDIPPSKRVQLERDILSLRAGLVRIALGVAPRNATLIDERFPSKGSNVVNRYSIENGIAQLGIHPGSHKFTVVAEGYQPQTWEFEAQPASSHSHAFNLSAIELDKGAGSNLQLQAALEKPSSRPTPPVVYAGAIATGALALGATGMGLMALSKKSDFEAANDGSHFSQAKALRSDMITYSLVSDVCLGAAIVTAGATAYFYITADSPAPPERRKSGAWRLTPVVGATQASVAWTGTF